MQKTAFLRSLDAAAISPPLRDDVPMTAGTTDDEGNGESRQHSAYTTVVRRRNSKKRPRPHTSPQQTPDNRQTTSQEQQQRQPRRVPAVIGTSSRSGGDIAAASKLRKKAVFCIHNVNSSSTVDSMKAYVSNMSVDVRTGHVCSVWAPQANRKWKLLSVGGAS